MFVFDGRMIVAQIQGHLIQMVKSAFRVNCFKCLLLVSVPASVNNHLKMMFFADCFYELYCFESPRQRLERGASFEEGFGGDGAPARSSFQDISGENGHFCVFCKASVVLIYH